MDTDDMVPILTESILAAYETPNEPLTLADRCDADCPAAAQFRFHRPPTAEEPKRRGVMEFCSHHARRHEMKLKATGWLDAHPKAPSV